MQDDIKYLLIDGNNTIYRGLFAGLTGENSKNYESIIIKIISNITRKFKPESTHIFWDSPTKELWRKRIFENYKSGRGKLRDYYREKYNIDIKKILPGLIGNTRTLFEIFGFKQYNKPKMEADDLIYAFIRSFRDPSVIISSDGDMSQIIFNYSHVKLYNPLKNGGCFIEVPNIDPVITKALQGDKSDNIDGFKGIGPKKAEILAKDVYKRQEFLSKEDNLKKFHLYKILIDMSTCPSLHKNISYVESKFIEKQPKKTVKQIQTEIMENKINILHDFKSYILPMIRNNKQNILTSK